MKRRIDFYSPLFKKKNHYLTLAGVAQWLSASLQIKGLPVQFPV